MTLRRRFILLLACVGAGAGVAAIGVHLTGSEAWYLAIPVAVAAGWLRVGTPENCCDADRKS